MSYSAGRLTGSGNEGGVQSMGEEGIGKAGKEALQRPCHIVHCVVLLVNDHTSGIWRDGKL